ncbi:hypothetical protein [Bacillus sp. FJAT-45350]|uniref:hypothetical protein n=1 Tax=Bacillus sp. FJAT-45350 TaxID=2011014 RepID=UPI000BB71030|nr:hypothetical protein [Bacillus sp. FJAT-45350]
MSRISRLSSSLKANRIRGNYVSSMNQTQEIKRVEPLDPVGKTKNPVNYPSENYLDSYDRYYEKLKELKVEFKKFYHHEKELYEAIVNLDENKQKVVKHTSHLIDKYNQALQALASFDKAAGTNHIDSIRNVFHSFSEQLEPLGVYEEESGLLKFQPEKFITYIEENDEVFDSVFSQFKKMILREYKSFTSIRVPKEQYSRYEQPIFNYKGLFIEEES